MAFYNSLNLSLKRKLLSKLCAPEIYEMFVYKHTETIEYVKK